MNSDDYFPDDLDSGILNQLDIIEAAHRPPIKQQQQPRLQQPKPKSAPRPQKQIERDDSFMDLSFDIDEAELKRLDSFIDAAYKGQRPPVAGPSNPARPPTSKNSVQTTLFGDVVHPTASTSKAAPTSRGPLRRTKSNPRAPFGQPAPKTKQWDHTAFAKSGWKKPKSKANADEDEQEEEEEEFEQFPAPFVSVCTWLAPKLKPSPPPMKLKVDMLEAKHWIYPLNRPKRDYQFNIVKHCLFDNTLVALPTGLGKTFIAGAVMLNYYRWFPDGKVVFVAPTKPLVAQQIDACHQTCGIPGKDAVELTGNNPRAYRSRMWEEKRVFYMTPQTLMNDLATENCDPRDIVLMVVDEAHKGTGDYAYAQIIRFLMAKNPHFRVLALTATPGSTPEAIQAIVDSLHVSRIEIRDEGSLDLRDYMHKKEVKQHIIKMSEDIVHFQQLLKTIMESTLKPLVARGVIEPLDVVKMHPYRATATIQRIAAQRNSPHVWAMGSLSMLGSMARAMSYLMEATVSMCLHALQEMVADKDGSPQKKKKGATKLKSDPTFQKLLADLEVRQKRPDGFGMHPKMETLKTLLVQHFGQRMADGEGGEGGGGGGTRAMVFVTYRECVDEIVEILNQESPLLKVTRFVGQGVDKQGKKGFAQKEQLEVIKKFKAGEFNVLVSTSIGEEGLDIGEVDMIVCYDAQKTPIRMLQRVGRTGRKRDGYVHVLLAEIREELNWDKAHDTYGELQKCIVRGDQLELYGDVPRLLPDQIRPQVLEKRMEIEEYVREETRKKRASFATEDGQPRVAGKKRKRNDDIDRNIPTGASRGFVSVAKLLVKGKKKKVSTRKFDDHLADDDSTDMELEGGLLNDIRRTASVPNTAESSSRGKGGDTLRKSRTMDPKKRGSSKKGKEKGKESLAPMDPSHQDDIDMELDQPMSAITHEAAVQSTSSKGKSHAAPPPEPTSPHPSSSGSTGSQRHDVKASSRASTSAERPSKHRNADIHSAGLADLDDPFALGNPTTPSHWASSPRLTCDEVIEITSSSPSRSLSPLRPPAPGIHPDLTSPSKNKGKGKEREYDQDPTSPVCRSPLAKDGNQDISWLLDEDEDEDPDIQIISSSPVVPKTTRSHPLISRHAVDESVMDIDDSIVEVVEVKNISLPQPKERCAPQIPPRTPPRVAHPSPEPTPETGMPEGSFVVRPARRRRVISTEATEIPSPPPMRRLRRNDTEVITSTHTSTPPLQPRKVKRKPPISIRHHPWLDGEAAHSGDEESAGSSHSEDDKESESDRQFLKDITDTQVSPSYDQTAAYRQSLFTQAPGMVGGPIFANKPIPRGGFISALERSRRRPVVSSSPPREDSEPDEYAFGSFVVADDAEISYEME